MADSALRAATKAAEYRKPVNPLLWTTVSATAGNVTFQIPAGRRFMFLVSGNAAGGDIGLNFGMGVDDAALASYADFPMILPGGVEFTSTGTVNVTWDTSVTAATVIEIRPVTY
tara:strand:- start:7477 stop:7818 length:342 start_codon:yes stop_codon:yes gene_type:complete